MQWAELGSFLKSLDKPGTPPQPRTGINGDAHARVAIRQPDPPPPVETAPACLAAESLPPPQKPISGRMAEPAMMRPSSTRDDLEPITWSTLHFDDEEAELSLGEDDTDVDEWPFAFDSRPEAPLLDQHWDESPLQDLNDEPDDSTPDITTETRARQLAYAYVMSIGELSTKNVELLSEIICARRWSAAQMQVRALHELGMSIRGIHTAFRLSEAWRESHAYDYRIDDGIGLPLHCQPRASWKEAGRVVQHVGEDASLDELLGFLDAELTRWTGSARFRAAYPEFKQYLFEHRLEYGAIESDSVAARLQWTAGDKPVWADGIGEFWAFTDDDPADVSYRGFRDLQDSPPAAPFAGIGIDELLDRHDRGLMRYR